MLLHLLATVLIAGDTPPPEVVPPPPVGIDRALLDIHEAFAVSVSYVAASASSKPIRAVPSDKPAPAFMGDGATLRTKKWQVRQADIATPAKGDRIIGGDDLPLRWRGEWLVIDITPRDDIAAWDLVVER